MLQSLVAQVWAGLAYTTAPAQPSNIEKQAHSPISEITGSRDAPELRLSEVLAMQYSADTT